MKAVILAAGYATRLYPLTRDFPKPLLEVGGKAILDHIIEKIERVDDIDVIYVVTNHRFYEHLVNWVRRGACYPKFIRIIDDGTISNEDRLGAIGDLWLVIEKEKLADDLLVMAGDNLFEFELTDMVAYFHQVGTDIISAHEVNELELLRRTGVVNIDMNQRVIDFEEKPAQPKSNLAVPPFYIYQRSTVVSLVKRYLDEGHNPDAPGHFIPWLIRRKPVHVYKFLGERYDIGTPESYEQIRKLYGKRD